MSSLLLIAAATSLNAAEPAATVLAAPARFEEAGSAAALAPIAQTDRWWTLFGDPELDALIERGLPRNGDVAIAAARVSLARAALRGAEAERMPRLTGIGSVASQSGALINAAGDTGSLYQLGVGASYDPDLLGRLSKSARAARLDAGSAAALLDSARLVAAADIAQTYFALRGFDAEGAVLAAGAADARDAVAIARRRRSDGLGTALDVARLEAELGAIEADLATIDRDRAAAAHALALLVGEEGTIKLGPWRATPLPEIPAGLPSEMLARRPDIAASRQAAGAARLRQRAAETAWFPSIGLTASGGQASPALGDLLRSTAQTFGLNLLLALPIFDGGRHKAAVRKAKAEVELGDAQERQTALRAFREVEDQLSAGRLLGEEQAAAERASAADRAALDIGERRFGQGTISRLELIDLRRRGIAGARRLARLRFARYAATVGLIRALGGGWAGAPSRTAVALNGKD